MAKLTTLPSQKIISGLKGKIDYYVYMGIPVARQWPRSPGRFRSPGVQSQWTAFATASRLWTQLSPDVQETYREMAQGGGLSGRDIFMKGYLSGIYRYPHS